MRLINADALWSYFKAGADWKTCQLTINLESLYDIIQSIAVVRCENCRFRTDDGDWCYQNEMAIPKDNFGCSYFEGMPCA